MPIVAEWGGQQCYWGGGQAISNYVEPDMSKGNYQTQLSVFCKDPVTGFGGHNGSKNFVMHYGYAEPGGYGMHDEMSLPYIYFTDYKARVIDHMYVTMSTYLVDCVFNGNQLTDPLGEEDWVRIVAIGLDENYEETAPRLFFELAGPNGIVADWQKWDLSPLGKVTMVYFNMTGSSDNGYGFSQPAYFAYDDVAVRWE